MARTPRRGRRSIFVRERLRASQLRTVAERRYGDARALLATGRNAHANGAMYLGGFVVECLLKAALIQQYPWLEAGDQASATSAEQARIRDLCYRSHALDEILDRLPGLAERMRDRDRRTGRTTLARLRNVASHWTIFARYSPRQSTLREAAEFLAHIKEIKDAFPAEVSR